MIKKAIDFGIEIESEHEGTYNSLKQFVKKNKVLPPKKTFFKKIAKDHLQEDGDYYKKLLSCSL